MPVILKYGSNASIQQKYVQGTGISSGALYAATYVPNGWAVGDKLTVTVTMEYRGASSGENFRLFHYAYFWDHDAQGVDQPNNYSKFSDDIAVGGSKSSHSVSLEIVGSNGKLFGVDTNPLVEAGDSISFLIQPYSGTTNSVGSQDSWRLALSLEANWDTAPGSGQGAQGLNPSQGGDITGVTAGKGMIGGGLTGNVTLNVVGGDGIEVGDDKVSAKLDGATLTAGASGLSVTNPFTAADETKLDGLTNVVANPNESVGGGDLTKLKVGSSVFSVPHLSVSAVGEDVSGETFVDVSSKTYSDNDVLVISVMELAGNGRVWSVILRFADILTTKMWIGTGYQGARFMIRRNNSKLQWSEGGAINADNKILVYKLSI